ncbi:hypothetical protein HY968_02700 [Candidatus Kaiserbacteria bacterium]|nr:hypothetical protein [Candidatus Kaiserbacteria bacterium]
MERARAQLNESPERKALIAQKKALVEKHGTRSATLEHRLNHIVALADELRLGKRGVQFGFNNALSALKKAYENEPAALSDLDDFETIVNRYTLRL